MRLIDRDIGSLVSGDLEISAETANALRSAYAGIASDEEMTRAIEAVRSARESHQWFACDCRADENIYPLIAPAYLTSAKTYYLRRLVGPKRPLHAVSCPFFRERPEPGLGRDRGAPSSARPPDGFFSVIDHEAARKVAGGRDQLRSITSVRQYTPPPLARQLWRLMRLARLNHLPPVQSSAPPSISAEFSRLRAAAENVLVSKGVPLARVLGTHPEAYTSNRLFAQIRQVQRASSNEAPLQGFLALFARSASQETIHGAEGADIQLEGGVATAPGISLVDDGPFLILAVIGDRAGQGGLAALRAYAQPIYSATQFMPVMTTLGRSLVKSLNSIRWSLAKRRSDLRISLEMPLFALETSGGPVRPDIMIEVSSTITGEVRTTFLFVEAQYEDASIAAHLRDSVGPVFSVLPADLEDEDAFKRRLKSALLF